MITFKIDPESVNYKVGWTHDEPYEKLYLYIRQMTPAKKIKKEKLELLTMDDHQIDIYRSSYSRPMPLPRLGNATYSFELCKNKSEDRCVIESTKEYIGAHEPLVFTPVPYGREFIKLSAACRYDICAAWFWLGFQCPQINKRFHFEPMRKEQGRFTTSCLLKKEALAHLDVFLDEKIADYINVVKKF